MNIINKTSYLLFCVTVQEKNTEVAESIYLITSFLTIGIRMKTWIYPISIPFTEDIFKLLCNFLLVITNNDKRSSINTLILEDITDRCRSFIFGGETVMQMFLREILQELKGVMCVLLLQCCVLLVIFEEKIARFVVFFVIHVRIEIHEIKLRIEFVLLQ